MTPALSVVIPTWNGLDLLQRFLPSVCAAAGPTTEIIISDDGSTDETRTWLTSHYPRVRCLFSPVNGGFAPAANAGIRAASAPIIVLLNNDLEVAPDCFSTVAGWFSDPQLFGLAFRALYHPSLDFAAGGKLGRFRRGFWEVWRNYDAPPEPGARYPSFMLVGGYCAFRRQPFLDLGGFDVGFAPYYSEDVDLSYRARKRGWKLQYEPRAVVHHVLSASVARHRSRFRRQIVIERNRLLFHWRNLDPPQLRSNLLWAHLLLIQHAFQANPAYHLGFLQALARWPSVRRFRQQERLFWRLQDNELELTFGQTLAASAASPKQEPL